MTLFGKKELLAQVENLKRENARLYVLGLKQAQEMKAEVEKLLHHISTLEEKNQLQRMDLENQSKTFQETTHVSDQKLREVQSESELLLLQLHQVQEELESIFLKEQAAQESIQSLNHLIAQLKQEKSIADDTKAKLEQERALQNETIASLIRDKGLLNEEKTKLTEARDEQLRIADERQKKIDGLSQIVDGKLKSLQEKYDQLEKEHGEGLQKIQALDQDRVNLNQTIHALNQEKSLLTQQHDEQVKLVSDKQNKIDSLSRMVDGQLKEVQEENELLLLQLHQVQEELEHHFLEHQKLQRENELLQTRWRRLEERDPLYLDYESILPLSVDTVSNKPRIDWRVKDITIAQEYMPQFDYTTFLEDGMPGIEIIDKPSGEATPNDPIRLIPRSLVKPNAQKALALYRNMPRKHWQYLVAALRATEEFFKSPKKTSRNQKLPDFFDPIFWRQTLAPLVADFKSLPAVFRFDEVKLKREQVNPDYEHLWLEFNGAMFGRYTWPSFEIRFAGANIQPGGFSRHPKFEIPKIANSRAPFDSWFEESVDDFGSKMELRFDLNKQFFDLDVWSKMSAEDRSMLISLIGSIPYAIKKLEDEGVIIQRPWDHWALLASGAVEILRRIISEAEKLAKEAKVAELEQSAVSEPPNGSSASATSEDESLNNQKLVDEAPKEIPEIKTEPSPQNKKPDKRFLKKKRR